ncbi:unnamed protein product [Clavelina lepadiformis]|uniref:Uncharacterized protein n=1 Tax=Clavelina lepadiformis TaxID=159417 RepID=A0ABP0FHD9_CLALP
MAPVLSRNTGVSDVIMVLPPLLFDFHFPVFCSLLAGPQQQMANVRPQTLENRERLMERTWSKLNDNNKLTRTDRFFGIYTKKR